MNRFGKAMLLFFLVGITGVGYAQIDRGELEGSLAPVTFSNYEGPHARIETREQIRRIGVTLGQAIRAGAEQDGALNRYFVIHSVSAPDGNKLDADIFGLGANVGVDHIRNLRTIIQGYLQEAYGYSERDAVLLAEFISIYNAVYRENWGFFTARYKAAVIRHLEPKKVGLSTRYSEWPGMTLMLIPLNTAGVGGISTIDTTAISDSRVIEELRKDDGRGIEQRREMVEFKEREAETAEKAAEAQREAIREEEKAIAGERIQLEREQQQTAEERRQLEEEKAQGTVTSEEAAKREEEISQREEETQQKSEELEKREEALVLQKEEAAKQEAFAEQKVEEAQQDRESIAQDQQSIIMERGGEHPQGLIGIVMERKDSTLGRLVAYDPATRKELRRSPLDTVYARTLTFVGGKLLAIAGENRGNSAVRLIEINIRTLEMEQQGDDDIHPNSLIWINGRDLYAITASLSDGTLNVGRFNADLALQAKSAIAVHPNAAVSIQQGDLLVQKTDGSTVLLNPMDLTER
ncbi:MAG: hypothetical protein FWC24_06940 [Treponema sp.]|nr:hypothetical protein [Treponema sp.]